MTIKRRKIRCIFRNILAVILTAIYSFANYFMLYKLCELIFTELIAIILVSIFLVLSIIVISFVFISQNAFSSLQTNDEKTKQEILNEYSYIISDASKYSMKAKKAKLIVSNSELMRKYSFGSPGVASTKNIFITDDTSTDSKYIVPGVIAHELGHIDSGFTAVMVVCNILNFVIVYLGRMFANIAFSLLFTNYRKNFKGIIKKLCGTLLYLISFVILLPYNILFSSLYISEEKDADLFAHLMGYGYSVKYFLSEYLDKKAVAWLIMLVLPLHPFTYNRISRMNKLSGFSNEMMFTHIVNDTLFAYNGKSQTAYFDCKIIGDSIRNIKTSAKKIILGNNVEVISDNAFFATSIEEIEGSVKVKEIGKKAFSHCVRLKTVNFQSEAVCERAFYNCLKLEEVDISQTKIIENMAFLKCPNLKLTPSSNLIKLTSNAIPTHLLETDDYNNYYFNNFLVNTSNSQGFVNLENKNIAYDLNLNDIIVFNANSNFENCYNATNDKLNNFKDYLLVHIENNIDEAILLLSLAHTCIEAFNNIKHLYSKNVWKLQK